jgi:NAD+ kinase
MLHGNATVSLSVSSREHHFLVSVDGRSETLRDHVCLEVSRAPYSVQVVKRPGGSFYRTLREKLQWNTRAHNH